MTNKKSLLFSTIVSGMVGLSVSVHAGDNSKMKAEMGGADKTFECKGGNECVAKGDCGGPGYSCAGNNACKGKGFIMTESQLECNKLVAKVSRGKEKKSGKKASPKKSG